MGDLTEVTTRTTDGLVLRVRAAPGAPKTKIIGRLGDALKVAVQAPPERGKANDELIRFLAGALGIDRAAIILKSGEASRQKSFRLMVADPERIETIIRSFIGDGK